MNYFRRLTIGLVARIDELCARVENHEALADAALRDLQSGTAQAQARLARVRRDGEALQRALGKERMDAVQWRDRARRITDDEARALECLRRSKRAERKAEELERRAGEHEKAERELGQDVRVLAERLDTLREQRNLMRVRQTRAEVFASVQAGSSSLSGELDSIFERWEEQITHSEFLGGCRPGDEDALELELASAEEQAELRAELERLRGDDE